MKKQLRPGLGDGLGDLLGDRSELRELGVAESLEDCFLRWCLIVFEGDTR